MKRGRWKSVESAAWAATEARWPCLKTASAVSGSSDGTKRGEVTASCQSAHAARETRGSL